MSFQINYKEIRNFLFLYFFTILFVYYTNTLFKDILFLVYLFLFIKSKNKSFWLAFFISLAYAPGMLFNSLDPNHGLLEFRNGQIVYFTLTTSAIIVKVFTEKRRFIKPFSEIYIWIFSSLLFLIIGFSFGISGAQLLRNLKDFYPFLLLIYLPSLMSKKEDYENLMLYLIGFGFFVFFCQIYVIVFGKHIMSLFGGYIIKDGAEYIRNYDSEYDLVRPNYSTMIVLLNIFSTQYFQKVKLLSNKDKQFFTIALFISIISIFVTATRGYIIGASIIVLVGLRIQLKNYIRAIIPASILLLILGFTTNLLLQLSFALKRFETIFAFLQGDTSANGTLSRVDDRAPDVLYAAKDSAFFGKGLSNITGQFADGHVAWPTIYLQGGILGVLILLLIIISLMFKIYNLNLKNSGLNILILGLFLALVFVHSTSYMVFSFLPGNGNIQMFIYLIAFIRILQLESKNNNI